MNIFFLRVKKCLFAIQQSHKNHNQNSHLWVVSVKVLQFGLVGVSRPVHGLLWLRHAVLQFLELKWRGNITSKWETLIMNPFPFSIVFSGHVSQKSWRKIIHEHDMSHQSCPCYVQCAEWRTLYVRNVRNMYGRLNCIALHASKCAVVGGGILSARVDFFCSVALEWQCGFAGRIRHASRSVDRQSSFVRAPLFHSNVKPKPVWCQH